MREAEAKQGRGRPRREGRRGRKLSSKLGRKGRPGRRGRRESLVVLFQAARRDNCRRWFRRSVQCQTRSIHRVEEGQNAAANSLRCDWMGRSLRCGGGAYLHGDGEGLSIGRQLPATHVIQHRKGCCRARRIAPQASSKRIVVQLYCGLPRKRPTSQALRGKSKS